MGPVSFELLSLAPFLQRARRGRRCMPARPRLDCESHATGLDPNDVGALLVAGLGPAAEHFLVWLLALNGLLVSGAGGATFRRWVSSTAREPC